MADERDVESLLAPYRDVLADAGLDGEELTILVARGVSPAEVVTALGAVEDDEIDWDDEEAEVPGDTSYYRVVAVDGGVLAVEHTGYADPPLSALRSLTVGGRAAAVLRNDIQGHERFAWARDGEVVLDAHEYGLISPDQVPESLGPLFAEVGVEAGHENDDDRWADADSVAVRLAMSEVATGLLVTAADLGRLDSSPPYKVACFRYVEEESVGTPEPAPDGSAQAEDRLAAPQEQQPAPGADTDAYPETITHANLLGLIRDKLSGRPRNVGLSHATASGSLAEHIVFTDLLELTVEATSAGKGSTVESVLRFVEACEVRGDQQITLAVRIGFLVSTKEHFGVEEQEADGQVDRWRARLATLARR